MVGEQRPQPFHIVAPVAVQLTGHAEPGHHLRAGGLHAAPGGVTGDFVESARGIGDDEDIEALFQRIKLEEPAVAEAPVAEKAAAPKKAEQQKKQEPKKEAETDTE